VVTALLRRLKIAAEDLRAAQPVADGRRRGQLAAAPGGEALADALGLPLFVPPIALSTDNAAMIGAAAFVAWRQGGGRAGTSTPTRTCPSPDAG
jgi:N6-L-threonylcarbamoyladenine synthase